MGWIFGPLALIACAYVIYYAAILLIDCYRTDQDKERRNYTYMDVVRLHLGPRDVFLCFLAQYAMLQGTMIGYNIVASTSMMAGGRSNCFPYKGHDASCGASGNLYMIILGAVEIILSIFSNLKKITLITVVAALMSFTYSFIGFFLCITKLVSHHSVQGTLLEVKVSDVSNIPSATSVIQGLKVV